MPEQKELQKLKVRPIKPDEESIWNENMKKHHYLGFRQLVGKSIKYIAELNGQYVALIGWCTAAFKCAVRDEWIGWTKEQQYQRLMFIANNSRFLILPGVRIPNLASKILSLNLKRLSADWISIFKHPIIIAETFVDQARFAGTCYRASGWQALGQTLGFGRNAGKYYYHGMKKTVFVYPLHRRAKQLLSDCFLAPELTGGRKEMINLNQANLGEDGGLVYHLKQMNDPRKKRGIRHSSASILSIAACAVLSGANGFTAIAEWAADLSQEMLNRLGCRFDENKLIYKPPSEPTLRRQLKNIDANEFDNTINQWLSKQADPDAYAVDGKTLKGARDADGKQMHLMSAIMHKEGVVAAQKEVGKKTNEITVFQPLLDPLDLEGKVVTADAMHTQVAHATYLIEEKKADYLFTVKGNQETLLDSIKALDDEDFSPCTCH